MTGDRTKFKDLDEALKSQVRLGDNKKLRIEGYGEWPSYDKVVGKTCEGCIVGKQAKQSFPTCKSKRAEGVLELIHANLCGPMRTESLAGSKYFMLLTDDSSRMRWVYFLKYKYELFDCFKKFNALVEKKSGKSIKVLRTDRGGEFLSKEFNDFCDEHAILRQLTAPYTLEQNGVAERKNRTIVEMTRFYEPISKKINISRNVVFDEDACWNWDDQKAPFESQGEEFITDVNQDIPSSISTSISTSQFVSASPTSLPTSPMTSSPVTNGNNTVIEIDYEETFSPVARFETISIILAVAAKQQWKLYHFYMKSAFLNGDLKEDVYVSKPPGFESMTHTNKVFCFPKVLYGLKQAPRAWYSKIDEFFHENGFIRSQHEPTLYVKWQGTDILIVSLYVDDMIYASSSSQLIFEFQASMKKMFDMTDLGELRSIFGLEIIQGSGGIFMKQRKYMEDTLKKFHMAGCKITPTPMNINEKFSIDDGTCLTDVKIYRSLVGMRNLFLKGIVIVTRQAQLKMNEARQVAFFLAQQWYLGDKKKATVALSSTKAEYVSATEFSCQAVWLRRILADLGQEQFEATNIMCDNISSVMLAKNPILHVRTKHMEVKHHYIWELIAKGQVRLENCRTDEQVADLLTKALPQVKRDDFKAHLGVSMFE
uniref:Integrase catalytic domain-containing protein n=1 Tax=Tanacetum cinerariifolium TaxID=118510 RepID=A0A6L2JPX3_TANCI|nr:hypothetical protein [Tanacetum cinerariifolium]